MGCERFVNMANCLVVDPSEHDRLAMCDLLKTYAFELETTGDATEALERCIKDMPDVVVFSGRLEGMDTATFLGRLTKAGARRKPVILMYCEEPDLDDIGRAIWDGANACLVKPFDARILDDKLHQAGAV